MKIKTYGKKNKRKFDSISSTIRSTRLPMQQRIEYKLCTLMFNCLHCAAPVYTCRPCANQSPGMSVVVLYARLYAEIWLFLPQGRRGSCSFAVVTGRSVKTDTGSVPANLWRQTGHSTGPWWSDATARAAWLRDEDDNQTFPLNSAVRL